MLTSYSSEYQVRKKRRNQEPVTHTAAVFHFPESLSQLLNKCQEMLLAVTKGGLTRCGLKDIKE